MAIDNRNGEGICCEMRFRYFFVVLLSVLLLTEQASALWQINFKEVGPDVVVTASGNLDLTGLSIAGTGATEVLAKISTAEGVDVIIASEGNVNAYMTPAAPSIFSEEFDFTGVSTGNTFGIAASPSFSILYTSVDFTTGALAGSITFSDLTLAELGVNPFELTWGEGENQGYAITVGSSVPEPTSTALAVGLGSLCFLVIRFRCSRRKD